MKDKTPTGAATVTYENPDSAKRAIDFFDEKDFKGEVNIDSNEFRQKRAGKLIRLSSGKSSSSIRLPRRKTTFRQ